MEAEQKQDEGAAPGQGAGKLPADSGPPRSGGSPGSCTSCALCVRLRPERAVVPGGRALGPHRLAPGWPQASWSAVAGRPERQGDAQSSECERSAPSTCRAKCARVRRCRRPVLGTSPGRRLPGGKPDSAQRDTPRGGKACRQGRGPALTSRREQVARVGPGSEPGQSRGRRTAGDVRPPDPEQGPRDASGPRGC